MTKDSKEKEARLAREAHQVRMNKGVVYVDPLREYSYMSPTARGAVGNGKKSSGKKIH